MSHSGPSHCLSHTHSLTVSRSLTHALHLEYFFRLPQKSRSGSCWSWESWALYSSCVCSPALWEETQTPQVRRSRVLNLRPAHTALFLVWHTELHSVIACSQRGSLKVCHGKSWKLQLHIWLSLQRLQWRRQWRRCWSPASICTPRVLCLRRPAPWSRSAPKASRDADTTRAFLWCSSYTGGRYGTTQKHHQSVPSQVLQ